MVEGCLEAEEPSLAASRVLGRLPLAGAVRVALFCSILLVLFGSGSDPRLVAIGSPLRWIALAAFTGLALLWSVAERVGLWQAVRAGGPGLLLAALGVGSAAWSVSAEYTLERCVAFGCVVVGAAAAAATVRSRRELAEALAATVVLAAVVVCLGGALLYPIDSGEAAQQASLGTGFRFAGLGQSPNTVPMIACLAIPLAAWLALTRTGRARVPQLAALAIFLAEVIASGSRGGATAVVAAALVFAVAAPGSRRRRALSAALAAAIAVVVVGGNRIVQHTTALPVPPATAPANTTPRPAGPRVVLPLFQDELGGIPTGGRSFFGNDGRAQALQEAFDQGSERPVAGWGFGTEARVFFDRVAQFHSNTPEDSFLGLYLTLGAAGVVAWLLAGVAAATAVLRARRLEAGVRLAVACLAAGVAAGFGLGIGESFVYAAGNVATLTFWLLAALTVALVPPRSDPGRSIRRYALAAAVVVVALIPLGRWEASHARVSQNTGIRAVWERVGGRLDAPNLDGFRLQPPLLAAEDCLLYRAGGSPGGYELCFADGRAVQAIDRRNTRFTAWSILPLGPSAASLRVSPQAVQEELRRLGAFAQPVAPGLGYQAR